MFYYTTTYSNKRKITRSYNYLASTFPDDRPLYWARKKMEVALKSHPFFVDVVARGNLTTNPQLNTLIWKFEELSRNYTGIDFSVPEAQGKKKILICGFDPFQLDPKSGGNPYQSNPSGVCALAFHGQTLGNGYVQTLNMPVRYPDFDGSTNSEEGKGKGIIEKYVAQFIGNGANDADMIITCSQSGMGSYHIDRFATINRGGSEDNLNFQREENSNCIQLQPDESDLGWIETTLPLQMAMSGGENQTADDYSHFVIYAQNYSCAKKRDNRNSNIYTDIAPTKYNSVIWNPNPEIDNLVPVYNDYVFAPDPSNPDIPKTREHPHLDHHDTIYWGSGGNYLSNESFYRVALARERWLRENPSATGFSTGHFHVAKLQDGNKFSNIYQGDFWQLTFSGYDKVTFKSHEDPPRTVLDELLKLIKTVKERIIMAS